MGPIFGGEVRLLELSFENDPAIAAGATLASDIAITILEKIGEGDVTDTVVLDSGTTIVRADPIINGTGKGIMFWALAPVVTTRPTRYLVRGEGLTSANEIAKARDVLLVE